MSTLPAGRGALCSGKHLVFPSTAARKRPVCGKHSDTFSCTEASRSSLSCTGVLTSVLIHFRTSSLRLTQRRSVFYLIMETPAMCPRASNLHPPCLQQTRRGEGTGSSQTHATEEQWITHFHKPNSEKGTFSGNTKWQYF